MGRAAHPPHTFDLALTAEHFVRFLTEGRRFGFLIGRQHRIELRPSRRPDRQHLPFEATHRSRQLLDLRRVARLHRGRQRLAILVELLRQRLRLLPRALRDRLGLLLLRRREREFLPHLPPHSGMNRRRRRSGRGSLRDRHGRHRAENSCCYQISFHG